MAGPKVTITVDDSKLRQLIADTKGPAPVRIVADGVEYGLYVHEGVTNAFGRGIVIGPRPFMSQAVEKVRPGFNRAFKNCLSLAQAAEIVDKNAFDVERFAKENAPVDTSALRNSIHVVDGDTFETTFEKLSHGEVID